MEKKILDKKIALITGSNRGIGFATLKLFSENGANIIACARKKDDNFETKIKEITGLHKNIITPVYFDLAKEEEIKSAVEKIKNIYPNIDVLVNNAGVNQISLFQMTKLSDIRTLFEINFFSILSLTQKIIKNLNKNKNSKIINIASNAAVECDSGRSAYAASKSAIIAFTKVLAKELGHYNICVNAIAPGLVETNMMNEGLSKKILEETINKTPLKKVGKPEDVAKTILYLASDQSSHVTGETIFITGGY